MASKIFLLYQCFSNRIVWKESMFGGCRDFKTCSVMADLSSNFVRDARCSFFRVSAVLPVSPIEKNIISSIFFLFTKPGHRSKQQAWSNVTPNNKNLIDSFQILINLQNSYHYLPDDGCSCNRNCRNYNIYPPLNEF